MDKERIEEIINKIAKERDITIEYFKSGTVRVSSPEMTLVGSAKEFDKAMIEVASKYKQ